MCNLSVRELEYIESVIPGYIVAVQKTVISVLFILFPEILHFHLPHIP